MWHSGHVQYQYLFDSTCCVAASARVAAASSVDEAIVNRASQAVASTNLNMGGVSKGTFQAT